MATSRYVGIDVSKDRLDVAMLGERQTWQVDNTKAGIQKLVGQMQKLCPELIVVEATGGYQRQVVDALFHAGFSLSVVNPARVRQFARAMDCSPRQINWMRLCWQSLGKPCSPGAMQAKQRLRSG